PILLCLVSCQSVRLGSSVHEISSAAELTKLSKSVRPDDIIVLKDGTYTDQVFNFSGKGKKDKPITLKAESQGKVILNGSSKLLINGKYLVVDGLSFIGGALSSGSVVEFAENDGGNTASQHCVLRNTVIKDYNPDDKTLRYFWVTLNGYGHLVEHCKFSGHDHSGVTLCIRLEKGKEAGHTIRRNHFANRPQGDGNGFETVRIGTGGKLTTNARCLVTENLFEECNGEIEIVSNKSCENVYSSNTFVRCAGTLTIRQGHRCRVENNVFIGEGVEGCGGVRVTGMDHRITGNYFSGLEAVAGGIFSLKSGVAGNGRGSYAQVSNLVLADNTLIGISGHLFRFGNGHEPEKELFRPENISLSNNLMLVTSPPAKVIRGGYGSQTIQWANNVIVAKGLDEEMPTGIRLEIEVPKEFQHRLQPNVLTASDVGPIKERPNIVVILADDLGYGDVKCLNPKRCKIATPNLDDLASQGMIFTDAHSTSSVCTPTRYSLLTGRYNWRTRLQWRVLREDKSPLITKDRLTVGELLQQQGYVTGCIGKWHIGLNWQKDENGNYDYTKPFTDGPTERGFDWYFGVLGPGAPPHGFIENDRVLGELSVTSPPEMFQWGGKAGPMVPGYTLESMLPTHTDKACEFIVKNAAEKKPFFLYYALNAPHLPVVPNKKWIGSSGLGHYADFVQELDYEVGRVIDAIDGAGIKDNTLIIFTSDNGCTPMVGTATERDLASGSVKETVPDPEMIFKNKRFTKLFTTGRVLELEAKGHYPSANMRGYKSDTWDGGHRVPFIVRWPEHVKAGTKCNQLVSLVDIMATCADIHDVVLPPDAGEDSVSLLPVIKNPDKSVRDSLVHHSFYGKFAIREDKWKLMLSPGSGGWWPPKDPKARKQGLPPVQLYDMEKDLSEQNNLQAKHPEIVKRLTKLLEKFVADGRSTPGPKQSNDVPVDICKKDT
ncbi:hypothetical protein BVX97_05030, partial [bacterium E08(2017)]